MPIIYYKTMTLNVQFVQGRRIICQSCQTPFNYLWHDTHTSQTTGLPVVSSDDSMRDGAANSANKALKKLSKKKRQGEGMCPHCHMYQSWMVGRSLVKNIGCGFIGGLVVLGFLPGIICYIFEWLKGYQSWVFLGGAILGVILGVLIGYLTALKSGPHPDKQDPGAKTDEELQTLIQECEAEDYDPFLYWWISMGFEPSDDIALVSLGLRDETDNPIFPEEYSSEQMMG